MRQAAIGKIQGGDYQRNVGGIAALLALAMVDVHPGLFRPVAVQGDVGKDLTTRPIAQMHSLTVYFRDITQRRQLEQEREQLLAILPTARPRLDSLRLVASTDFLQLRR